MVPKGFESSKFDCIYFMSQHEKTYLVVCETNEDSNQTAHPRSLIRGFVIPVKNFASMAIKKRPSEDSDQTDLNLRWVHV